VHAKKSNLPRSALKQTVHLSWRWLPSRLGITHLGKCLWGSLGAVKLRLRPAKFGGVADNPMTLASGANSRRGTFETAQIKSRRAPSPKPKINALYYSQ
jgi:hypothetical protein